MSEFKGTKAPWGYDIDESNSSIDLVLPNDTVISYSRHSRFTSNFVIERDEMNANIKLISKAPEMLDMLSGIAPILERYGEIAAHKEVLNLIKESTTL